MSQEDSISENESLSTYSPDPYEKNYMSDEGGIVHREQFKAPIYMSLLMLIPLLTMIPLLFVNEFSIFLLLFTALPSFLVWNLFYKLRISVSQKKVYIQYGLFGPEIPLDSIVECRALDYDWKEFGGWGIRRAWGKNTWAYNLPNDKGKAVLFTWRNQKGKLQKTLVSSKNPARLVQAVQQAKNAGTPREERDTTLYEEALRIPEDERIRIDEEALQNQTETVSTGVPDEERQP